MEAYEAVQENTLIYDIQDLNKARKYFNCSLVNTKANKEDLKCIPHREILDLSMVCRMTDLPIAGNGSVLVRHNLLEKWDLSEKEFLEMALENTRKRFPQIQKDMFAVPICAFTNRTETYGASILLFPEILCELAGRIHSDLLILPSSIHEMMVMPGRKTDILWARDLIRKANKEILHKEEWLSDEIYYFSKKSGKITIAK